MHQRQKDKRYRDGVDTGRMSSQRLALPVKKDFKPKTPPPPSGLVTVIVEANGKVIKTIPFEDLPKQYQRHLMAKIERAGKKIK